MRTVREVREMIAGWERTKAALSSGLINVDALERRIEECGMNIDLLIDEEIEMTEVPAYSNYGLIESGPTDIWAGRDR